VDPRGRVLATSVCGHLGQPRETSNLVIRPCHWQVYNPQNVTGRHCKSHLIALLALLVMTFKDVFSTPTTMLNVCTHAFFNFCHNHLGIQIHHDAKETECIESSSGPARTHAYQTDSEPTTVGPRVEHKDEFICKGGVDAGRLLSLARKGLYSTATKMGGNVLLEEKSVSFPHLCLVRC